MDIRMDNALQCIRNLVISLFPPLRRTFMPCHSTTQLHFCGVYQVLTSSNCSVLCSLFLALDDMGKSTRKPGGLLIKSAPSCDLCSRSCTATINPLLPAQSAPYNKFTVSCPRESNTNYRVFDHR